MPKGNIKQKANPVKEIRTGDNPDRIMSLNPSWAFASCDTDGSWAFSENRIGERFWNFIFPKLRDFETQTWGEIFIRAKKNNHSIDVLSLNKVARDRIEQLKIEVEAIYSLRLSGNIRLYGILVGSVFNILWYDTNHGDNDTCVCKSSLKRT